MRRSFRFACLPVTIATTIALAGCGQDDGLARQAVSGSITLDGSPLERGSIQFQPEPTAEPATAAGAIIEDGSYSIARDQGPVPGTYQVSIFASSAETIDEEAMPGELAPISKELIPRRYNAETTLTAEVEDGGDNTFDFELSSQ